jgi:hypothetical protein
MNATVLRLVYFDKVVLMDALKIQFLPYAPSAIQPHPVPPETRIVSRTFVCRLESVQRIRRTCVIKPIKWLLAAMTIEPSAAPPPVVASRLLSKCPKHQPAALNVELVVLVHLLILVVQQEAPFQNLFAILGAELETCSVVLPLPPPT